MKKSVLVLLLVLTVVACTLLIVPEIRQAEDEADPFETNTATVIHSPDGSAETSTARAFAEPTVSPAAPTRETPSPMPTEAIYAHYDPVSQPVIMDIPDVTTETIPSDEPSQEATHAPENEIIDPDEGQWDMR